jgi:hypothetical protein
VATNDDDGEDMTRTASSMTTNSETDTIGDGGDMAIDYDNDATCSSTAAAALATTAARVHGPRKSVPEEITTQNKPGLHPMASLCVEHGAIQP